MARIASGLSKLDLIVRFQGGNNAGHTIYHKGQSYVFKLIPSGVFGKARIHLGAGMVINPAALLQETKTIPKSISFLDRLFKTLATVRLKSSINESLIMV